MLETRGNAAVSRRLAALLVVIMILAPLASSPSLSQQPGGGGTVEFFLPAVEDGGLNGRLIKAALTVKPGSGFKVVAGGEVDPTTELSMKMAIFTSLLIAGVSWRSIGAEIRIESQGPVAGPSGSLATAAATMLALTVHGQVDMSERYGYVVTGAITPGGLAAQVGGIPAKCDAANRSGYTLVIPLVNKPDAPSGCDYVGVASVLDILQLMGWPEIGLEAKGSLPDEFNESMRNIAEDMRGRASEMIGSVEGLPSELYQPIVSEVRSNIERSIQVEGQSPYASASLAFGALSRAYQVFYYNRLFQGDDIRTLIEELENEVSKVKSELDSMDMRGSMLYVELLAVAYTRLADAEASLASLKASVDAGATREEIVNSMAYIRARIDSIKGWLGTAKAVENIGRDLSVEELRIILDLFKEYSTTSMEYGRSLVEYMVNVYGLPEERFRPYLASLETIEAEASRYEEQGNYIAVLGFLRDGISRTLRVISVAGSAGLPVEDIMRYYEEMGNIVALLMARAFSLGFQSGLATAYMEYASVLMGMDESGFRLTAIAMMEEAVASAILWAIAAESLESSVEAEAPQNGSGGGILDGDETVSSGALFTAAIIASAVFFLLGLYISSRAFARSARIWS